MAIPTPSPLARRRLVLLDLLDLPLSGILAVRAFSPGLRRFLSRPLLDRKVPIVRKHVTVSAVLVAIWILALYGIVFGVWWIRLRDYFDQRGCNVVPSHYPTPNSCRNCLTNIFNSLLHCGNGSHASSYYFSH